MNLPFRQILRLVLLSITSVTALALTGCPSPGERADSLDSTTLPLEVRADYEVFAQRCSKCHSLSRPLNSGIVDDDYWSMYVARMRRQPASGISLDDSRVILRFLHYYSQDQIRKKQARASSAFAPAAPGDAGAGTGTTTGPGDAG